jgi:hypothetical protein
MVDLATHLRKQMPRYELAQDERLERAKALLGEAPAPATEDEGPDLSEFHTGGGWYQIGDEKVQGKEAARAALEALDG